MNEFQLDFEDEEELDEFLNCDILNVRGVIYIRRDMVERMMTKHADEVVERIKTMYN